MPLRFGIPLIKNLTSRLSQSYHVSSKWNMHKEIVSLQQRTLPLNISLLTIMNIREMLQKCKQQIQLNELAISNGIIRSLQWPKWMSDILNGALTFDNLNIINFRVFAKFYGLSTNQHTMSQAWQKKCKIVD